MTTTLSRFSLRLLLSAAEEPKTSNVRLIAVNDNRSLSIEGNSIGRADFWAGGFDYVSLPHSLRTEGFQQASVVRHDY